MTQAIQRLRSEFPALEQKINGHPLVYLDSAATSLKPLRVIEALTRFYSFETANVHRGSHFLGMQATEKFEITRLKVAHFINANSSDEVVFTSGTTESINLVASSLGQTYFEPGDEIIISQMEHHSNIVPWQALAAQKNLVLKWCSVTDKGELDFDSFKSLLSAKTKLVSLTHCSNILGTVNPIKKFINEAKKRNVLVFIDAAQSILFSPIDVQALNCDFLAFSSHKMYGPYGVGILYGKKDLLNEMQPYQYGGAMINEVQSEKTTFLNSPQRFEAGTPNISGVISFSEAIEFVLNLGVENIARHEGELTKATIERLNAIPGVRMIGQSESRVNLASFVFDGIHAMDVGALLDQQGIAVRVGHHCCMPLMKHYGITSAIRVSFGVYNNLEDVEVFIKGLKKAVELLK